MLCFSHLQLYEKGEEEKNEVVLPLARNGEAKTRRTSLSIFNSPIFPTALYIDKDVKYWKSILAYGLHWCVVFSWYFLIPILHDLLCQSNKKTISTRNLSISGVAFTMTILHSALSRLWKICNLGGIRTFHFAFSKLRLHFKIAVIIFRWWDHKYNCCTIFFK